MATSQEYIKAEFGSLVGAKITNVRPLTDAETEAYGWDSRFGAVPFVIFLDNGKALIPSSDEEGNDAGFIFVEDTKTK